MGTYPAALATGAASKILSGQTLAGVAGNVTLPAAGKVYTGINYGVSGTGSTGTLTIPAAGNVLSTAPAYGDPGAQLTPSLTSQGTWNLTTSFPGAGYYAAVSNSPTAATIADGTTITGVAGTATLTPANCSSNAATGCVTTATYKSADLTNLSAGNIKSGITIAGQLGDYPSVTYTLPGADTTADLDNATFDAKVKSATAFEYWTSTGSRQTGAGDADITQANIKDTVSIFGTVGNLTAAVAPNSWDVRVGVTVNGVTGKLKVNCRNRVGSAFNYDGAISGIGQSGVTSGTAIDIWDTIDDYNNYVSGLPPSIVTAWGSNTDCGGIDTPGLSSDDDNVWKDVTTTNGTTASTCAATSANCTMQDKITGLWWSKQQTGAAWNTAWSTCLTTLNGTTYGTNPVPGYNGQTGWRLPTQKELMDAYNHGIRSAASDKWTVPNSNWITEGNMANYFWSGSSVSFFTSNAWYVNLAFGGTYDNGKNNTYQVVCVR